jgi:hypothetical protein
VHLVVDDGELFGIKTILIVVEGGVAAGTLQVLIGQVTADCSAGCEAVLVGEPGALGCRSFNSGVYGLDCVAFALADVAGKQYTLTSSAGDPDAEFFDMCAVDTEGPGAPSSTGRGFSSGPEGGTVPAGTGCVVVWEFNTVTPDAPSVLTFTYVGLGIQYCDVEADLDAGGFYNFEMAWVFRESNGRPGLQVANNHPTGAAGADQDIEEFNPAWADCEQGDQLVK